MTLWSAGTSASKVATVNSDANGSFAFNFNCQAGSPLMFVTTSGGNTAGSNNPGSAGNNSHLSLASALGTCSALPPTVVINEITTAATAYALSAFAPEAGATAVTFGANSTGSATGITNAFALISKLVDVTTGSVSTTGEETANSTLNLQRQLDTMANALAACNNSNNVGATSSACAELFACASPNAVFSSTSHTCTGGTITTNDTLNAALAISQNVGLVSSAGIFDAATGSTAYSPTLAAAPKDWSLALVYAITNSGPLAVDSSGNVWILSDAAGSPTTLTVVELAADGHQLSPSGGWTTGGISNIDSSDKVNLAIDADGNVWVGGGKPNIAEINSQGVGVPPTSAGWMLGGSGPSGTAGVAIDAAGNAWFADGGASKTFQIGATGSNLSGSGYAAGVCGCNGIVPDKSGAVWLMSGTGVAQMNATGVQGSAVTAPSGASLTAIAPDAAGDFWITDQLHSSVWQFTPSGASGTFSTMSFSNSAGSGTAPKGIVVDGAGHKWIANQSTASPTPSSVTELSSSGANLSPATGLSSGIISGAAAIAVDQSGNVWISDGNNSVSELVGAGAPTKNPLAAAVAAGNFSP